MDAQFSDIRFALRSLRRRPAFTLAAVLSLGLGLAASSAVFSVLNTVLFKPVSGVTRTDRLVEVSRQVGRERADVSWPVFERLRRETRILDDLAALQLTQVSIEGDAEPVARGALAVTGNYFTLFGVRTELGRTFAPDEAAWPRVAPVVVLSHEAWQRELQGDLGVIGRTIRINGVPVQVVGVLRRGFTGHHTALLQDVFLPLGLEMPGLPSPTRFESAGNSNLEMVGRLAPGISPAMAVRELSVVANGFDLEALGTGERPAYQVAVDTWGPLPGGVRAAVATFLGVLLGLAGLALAMACVNVTTIVLARAIERQRELAVRRAMGATRGRLVRQVITEVVVLFVLAGAAGLALASWSTSLLTSFSPPIPIPGRLGADFSPDVRVFLFALAVTFGAALTFSLLPALTASRFDIVPALREGAATDSRSRSRARAALVAAQMAFTTVLMIAAVLFGRALGSVKAAQPEWDLDGVVVSTMELELNGTTRDAGLAFYEEARRRIAAIPGVDAVAFAAKLPVGGRSSFGQVYRSGEDASAATGTDASLNRVTPDYFRSMRIPLRSGRDIAPSDAADAPRVAIVNEEMARRLWGERNPVGEFFFVGQGEYRIGFEVIGVTGNSRFVMPGRPADVQYFVPLAQWYNSSTVLHVRATPGFVASIVPAVKSALREVMPTLPVSEPRPITEALAVQMLPQRVATWVAATMGVFGLLLAAVGIYGVTAFVVSRCTRELAIRMALGATPGAAAELVFRRGARAPVAGIAVGLVAGAGLAFAIARLAVVPGVRAADPLVLLVAPLALAIIALAAMADPVRRAVGRPTMAALRED